MQINKPLECKMAGVRRFNLSIFFLFLFFLETVLFYISIKKMMN